MYLRALAILNIRSIESFKLTFAPAEFAGWHVVIGDNGSGKSTLVRSIALALVGPGEAASLRQNWANWLRRESQIGSCRLHLHRDSHLDSVTGGGAPLRTQYIAAGIRFDRTDAERGPSVAISPWKWGNQKPERYHWGSGSGWFSASYGPFRRFTGGDKEYAKLYYSHPKLAPHLSVFGEDVALTECLEWFRDMQFKRLEKKPEGKTLDLLRDFLNSAELLPHGAKLKEVTSDEVRFEDGYGSTVAVEQLSDGYRSILSLTFDLIRQLVFAYGADIVFSEMRQGNPWIGTPGVVLIDEIDAHLHPSWQRRIGHWFLKYFPKLQFIVTTHSPLICHAAEHGTIWRLPSPDSGPGGKVTGQDRDRLVFGNVLDAYSTEMFGTRTTKSDSALQKTKRLAELNHKAVHEVLSKEEERELQQLRAILPTAGIASES